MRSQFSAFLLQLVLLLIRIFGAPSRPRDP